MAEQANSTLAPTRRAFFGSAVASGIAATAPPIFTVPAASTLAAACAWAIDRRAWLDANEADLDDDEVDAETERMDGVFRRAVTEPSAGLSDVAAKARMLLNDLVEGGQLDEEHIDQRLIGVVLREIIALV